MCVGGEFESTQHAHFARVLCRGVFIRCGICSGRHSSNGSSFEWGWSRLCSTSTFRILHFARSPTWTPSCGPIQHQPSSFIHYGLPSHCCLPNFSRSCSHCQTLPWLCRHCQQPHILHRPSTQECHCMWQTLKVAGPHGVTLTMVYIGTSLLSYMNLPLFYYYCFLSQ